METLWDGVPLVRLPTVGRVPGALRFFWHVIQSDADVAWAMIWGWVGWCLLARKLLRGKPYVLWLDGYSHLAPWDATGWLRKALCELRYGLVLRGASIIYAEAPGNRELTQNALPHANLKLLSPGLWAKDLQRIEEQWARAAIEPQRGSVILYSGRIAETKRVDDLLHAFAALSDAFPGWTLDIRGDASDQLYLRRLVETVRAYGLADRVRFLPAEDGENVYRRFSECSVFCLPSAIEGFSTSIVEAMFFCGAIVAADSGWSSYQLQDGCGLIYRVGAVEELRDHLKALMESAYLREELRARAGENAGSLCVGAFLSGHAERSRWSGSKGAGVMLRLALAEAFSWPPSPARGLHEPAPWRLRGKLSRTVHLEIGRVKVAPRVSGPPRGASCCARRRHRL